MNKDFSKEKLLSFSTEKIFKVLYDLAIHIEKEQKNILSNSFKKLQKYHDFLADHSDDLIKKINKEFIKVKDLDYQYQVYLMNLERLLGQSSKEYEFLVTTKDDQNTKIKTLPIICLLDSIRSAHNVGAMFRNAECFGVEKIILCGLSPTPENQHVTKTCMGTDKDVSWEYSKNAIDKIQELKQIGYQIWSVETAQKAELIYNTSLNDQKVVLIFGHEHFGVSRELLELSDKIVKIPLCGNKNSLNVSVSQGIILSSLTSKLSK